MIVSEDRVRIPEPEPDSAVTYEYVNIAVLPRSPAEDAARDGRPRESRLEPRETPPPVKTTAVPPPARGPVGTTLNELEDEQIRKVLSATGGNKTKAAEILGIERKTLYRKLARARK